MPAILWTAQAPPLNPSVHSHGPFCWWLPEGPRRGILRLLRFSPADAARLICDGPSPARDGPFRVLGSR